MSSGSGLASAVVRALDEAGTSVDDVEVRPPSLDDVFFALTGHPADEPPDISAPGADPGPGTGRRPGTEAQVGRA